MWWCGRLRENALWTPEGWLSTSQDPDNGEVGADSPQWHVGRKIRNRWMHSLHGNGRQLVCGLTLRRKTLAAVLSLVERRIDRAVMLYGKATEDDTRSLVNGATAALAHGRSSVSALEAHLAQLDCRVSKSLEELSLSLLALSSSGAPGLDIQSQIAEGSSVELHSLRNSPQLNGQAGIAGAFDFDTGRWTVRLANGEGKMLRPENVRLRHEPRPTEDFDARLLEVEVSLVQLQDVLIKPRAPLGRRNASPDPPSHGVFVGNLDFSAAPKDLREVLAQCGHVRKVRILRDRSGFSRGCAFVDFEDFGSVEAALRLTGHQLRGRPLRAMRQISNRPPGRASA